MDRRDAYKAKPLASVLNRERRQFRDARQQKKKREDLLMTKRGITDAQPPTKGQKNDENERPKCVNQSAGSLARKKELEEWLKQKNEKKKEDKNVTKKPFYVGSRHVPSTTNLFSYSSSHVCCHGSNKMPQPETSKPAAAASSQPISRPQTRSQTVRTKPPPPAKPVNNGRRPPNPARNTTKKSTTTTSNRQKKTVAASGKTARNVAINSCTVLKERPNGSVSSADLPWITNSIVKPSLPGRPDFDSVFGESKVSPFRFGEETTTRAKKQDQFQFTFKLNGGIGKRPLKYTPRNSLVTFVRGAPGGPDQACEESFTYSPASDLMGSPVLTTSQYLRTPPPPHRVSLSTLHTLATSPRSTTTEEEEDEEPAGKKKGGGGSSADSIMRNIATMNTSSMQKELCASCSASVCRTPPPAPSTPLLRSASRRYGTRSNLEVSHIAPNTQVCEEERSLTRNLSQRLVLNDSLDAAGDGEGEGLEVVGGAAVRACREKHDREVERMELMCQHWEQKLAALEGEAPVIVVDSEILDCVRTVIGQTRLLMRQRMQQFLGLCRSAEDPHAEKLVTIDDLQSFWDMVYFQVEDVDRKFAELAKLEANDWKRVGTIERPKPKRRAKGKRAGAVAAAKPKRITGDAHTEETTSSSDSNSNSKREEMRRKLQEMRNEGRRTRSQAKSAAKDGEMGEGAFVQIVCGDQMSTETVANCLPPSGNQIPVVLQTVKTAAAAAMALLQTEAPAAALVSTTTTMSPAVVAAVLRGGSPRRSGRRIRKSSSSPAVVFKAPQPVGSRPATGSSPFDPAKMGYDFANSYRRTVYKSPLQPPPLKTTTTTTTTAKSDGDVDLSLYTTIASTPPLPPVSAHNLDTSLDLHFSDGDSGPSPATRGGDTPSASVGGGIHGNLIQFTPGSSRRKSRSSPAALIGRRGSMRRYSSVTPSKKVLSKQASVDLSFDYCVSPVRRSTRKRQSHLPLHLPPPTTASATAPEAVPQHSSVKKTEQNQVFVEVDSLSQLPEGKKVLVIQNPNLTSPSP